MTAIIQGTQRIEHLADLVLKRLTGAAAGHCVRINYLRADEAQSVCEHIREHRCGEIPDLHVYLLAARGSDPVDDVSITADRAIELRNRKVGCLCLFVPSDLIDATASSLGNSFAEIDGRQLHRQALDRVRNGLGEEALQRFRAINAELTNTTWASDDDKLELAFNIAEREHVGELDQAGFDLWRVGLITDARPNFADYLGDNRNFVRKLARPQRLSAPYRDRIQSLGVTDETATRLEEFFAHRALHDVRSWSHALIDAGLTLDQWALADAPSDSDLESVEVRSFTKADGSVVTQTKLRQKDGPGGALHTSTGKGRKITVFWDTTPKKPREVGGWLIEMVPSELDADNDAIAMLDLPSRQVRGHLSRTDIKLDDLATEDLPQTGFRIRVTASDAHGSEMKNSEGNPIAALSDEFYLAPDDEPELSTSTRRRTVDTLAFGRLEAAIESKSGQLEFESPSWVESGESKYFSIKAYPRTMLNIELSKLLMDIQVWTLAEPTFGGQWYLHVDETVPVTDASQIKSIELRNKEHEAWNAFLRARRTMFERIRKHESRYVIEAAEWKIDQLNGALNYAQAFASLLETLPESDLPAALSIDTLHLRIDRTGPHEDAVIVLPTHPLRLVWFAVHASLLHAWERELLDLDAGRKQAVDLDLLRELVPLNVPPFVFSAHDHQPYVFFRTLNAYHGVAFPPETSDPVRRLSDVGTVLGVRTSDHSEDQRHPQYLGKQLQRYRDGHSYADPLVLSIVNSDHGEMLAGGIREMLREDLRQNDDDDESPVLPSIDVTAYVTGDRIARLSGIETLRTEFNSRGTRIATDALRPALSTRIRTIGSLTDAAVESSHVSLVVDVTRPGIVPVSESALNASDTTASLSLYGLVSRFLGTFRAGSDAVNWNYLVVPWDTARSDPHPEGPRFGKILPETMAGYLRAFGRCLAPGSTETMIPSVNVAIDTPTQQFLERLHRTSDWVITIDRFFGVEYYDSPKDAALGEISQKHLIDYSPEFSDGLGHRTIVTTVWRDEINVLLRRALEELGFAAVDRSVRTLLHHLKLISGRLALQAASPTTTGTAAMSPSAVIKWLSAQGRLANSIVIPVDHHQGLFRSGTRGAEGQRRCDLVLVGFRRGIVDATFIEVKWRRGATGSLEADADEMRVQMDVTARAFRDRFFNEKRVDSALQRANLANTLRFYGRRSVRHGLIGPKAWANMTSHIEALERTNVDLRVTHEGFIVNLDRHRTTPMVEGDTTIRVLTAEDFEEISPELVGGTCVQQDTDSEATTEPDPPVSAPAPVDGTGTVAEDDGEVDKPVDQTAHNDAERHDDDRVEIDEQTKEGGPSEISVSLGTSISGDVTWRPGVAGSPHLFITGIPGQGKSWTIINILNQLAEHGVPALVFDFHGQFGEDGSDYVKTAQPRVINAAYGLPFSPFETDESSLRTNWLSTAMGVSEIFEYVCNLGEIQRDVLFRCIRDAYKSFGFDENTSSVSTYPTLENVLNRLERMERETRTQNLTARLRPLFEMDIFHHDLEDQSDLIETILNGLVIELHELPSETLQLMASAFILRKVYRDMFRWGVANRLRLVIILDEAHRLARDITLPKLMKEGRKFGVAVVVASQGLADFHPDVVSNAGTKIAFRANHNESRKIAGFFRMRTGQDGSGVLESLQVGQALVQSPEMETAVRTQMASLQ
jgi:DNA phosphorothioation-dependent restriction protein DptH